MIRIRHHFLSPFSRREWQERMHSMLGVVLQPACAEGGRLLVELILGRDGDISALNMSHMGCFGPTNILSFPSGFWGGEEKAEHAESADTAETDPLLGTLFLSVDTLRRESLLYGQDLETHAQRLLAHGLAHLLGYEHGPEMDELCAAMLESAFNGA